MDDAIELKALRMFFPANKKFKWRYGDEVWLLSHILVHFLSQYN